MNIYISVTFIIRIFVFFSFYLATCESIRETLFIMGEIFT